MKKYILISLFWLGFVFTSFAQTDSLQQQINEQVWKPFVKAFKNRDRDLMKSVHSKDIIRVELDAGIILGYDKYFQPIPDSIKAKWAVWETNIELHFIHRVASAGKAFEVGYYKTTSINTATKETRISYGKFHVLLRKENGAWKILMDEDAKENTDEQLFMSGKPMN